MDIAKLISTFAPALGTALGGPVGGMATKVLLNVFGLGDDATDSDIAKALNKASPDQLLALKQADYAFQAQMKELDVDLERIPSSDRDSARKREAAVKDWMPRILAGLVVVGFLATVFLILSGYVEGLKDPMTATTVGTLIGYISSKADSIISYYFGSSAGSAAKNEMLAGKKNG